MFVAWDGTFPNNPYQVGESHLLLFAGFSDILVVAELEDLNGYSHGFADFHRSAGRSLRGALRVQGSHSAKQFWQLSVLVNGEQVNLFHNLLEAQQNGEPIVIEDYFSGSIGGLSVWIDVDARYLTPVSHQGWWRLQFAALER
jgi:hypothetical protein